MATKPNLLVYLGLTAGLLFALRLALPAAAGHPLGRVVLLAVSVILALFVASLFFRIRRS